MAAGSGEAARGAKRPRCSHCTETALSRAVKFSSPVTLWMTVVLFAGSLFPAATSGQATERLKASSRLVVLDVTVVDAKGEPEAGLSQGDFTVYEGAEQQRIRSFEPFAAHTLPSGTNKDSVHGARDVQTLLPQMPVVILVLDELNTNFEDAAFARTAIKKYISGQPSTLPQPTSLLVATDASFEAVQDFTLDRQVLLDRLAKLPPALPAVLMRTAGSPEGTAIRFAQTLSSLQQIGEANLGLKARKNVVWVGRGFSSIDLRDSPDHQVQIVRNAAERTINLLRDAHVVLYTVDPSLSSSFVQTDPAAQPAAADAAIMAEVHGATNPFDGTVSFNTLAPESGGRAFSVFNDLSREIATSVADGSAFYTISYVPSGTSNVSKPYREIQVRVSRPGLTVLTRKGYFAATPPTPSNSAQKTKQMQGFDIAQAVISKMTFTGVDIMATVGAKPGSYVVQVNTSDLRWQTQADGSSSAELILAAVALDARNKPVAQALKQAHVRAPAEIEVTSIPFATLTIDLVPPAATDHIRFMLRDQSNGQLGSSDIAYRAGKASQ